MRALMYQTDRNPHYREYWYQLYFVDALNIRIQFHLIIWKVLGYCESQTCSPKMNRSIADKRTSPTTSGKRWNILAGWRQEAEGIDEYKLGHGK